MEANPQPDRNNWLSNLPGEKKSISLYYQEGGKTVGGNSSPEASTIEAKTVQEEILPL